MAGVTTLCFIYCHNYRYFTNQLVYLCTYVVFVIWCWLYAVMCYYILHYIKHLLLLTNQIIILILILL